MRFWLREIAGWFFILLGLYFFFWCYIGLVESQPPTVFQAPALAFIGFVLFRGGIHLLKVAVAARICSQVHTETPKNNPAKPAPPPAIMN